MTDGNNHPVLIIGGGLFGIVCALELYRLGVPVILIEKEASLGGLAARFCCKASELSAAAIVVAAGKRNFRYRRLRRTQRH